MLHMIGLILKIIGILLLAVLCLLLFLLLIVLLVPVRYQVEAEHGDDLLAVDGKVNWLLHLINAKVTYLEGILHIRVRVLWFTLYDNQKPKKAKVSRGKKTKIVKKKPEKTNRKDTVPQPSNRIKIENNGENSTAEPYVTEKYTEKGNISKVNISKENISEENISKDYINKENINTESLNKEVINTENINTENINKENLRKDSIKEKNHREIIQKDDSDNSNQEENNRTNHVRTEQISRNNIQIGVDKNNTYSKEEEKQSNNSKEADKEQRISKAELLFEKIRSKIQGIIVRLKSFKERWKESFISLKNKLQSILTSTAGIRQKLSLIWDFIRDEYNRQGFQITYSSIKKLLKHILPTKLRSRIVFGTGDPCSTGQALGAMSILYSFYGDKIQITPDFENKRLEGKHYARGRIRLITILIIVIKLMLDKQFQQLRKNFQILKEAL